MKAIEEAARAAAAAAVTSEPGLAPFTTDTGLADVDVELAVVLLEDGSLMTVGVVLAFGAAVVEGAAVVVGAAVVAGEVDATVADAIDTSDAAVVAVGDDVLGFTDAV